jgi:hypothetical protein
VTNLRTKDITTFEDFIQIVMSAVRHSEGKVKKVVLVMGITNYDNLFDGVIAKDVSGITSLKVLRCNADENGRVCLYYKVCMSFLSFINLV